MTIVSAQAKQEVYRLFQVGVTTGELGRQFGVSRQRIHQLIKKAGLVGGRKLVPSKAARKQAAREARLMAKWGCTHAEWLEFRRMAEYHKDTPMGRFALQKKNAHQRGVEWNLTFKEWWAIWVDSGKWYRRGKMIGEYVMARFKDQGPYSVDNVYITTSSENCRDGRLCARGRNA